MKIVQLLHGNQIGGMETFCVQLSNALAKQHDVILIADPVFAPMCDTRVRFEPLDVERSRNNPLFLWSLYRTLRRIDPDIIHAHKQNSIYMLRRLSLVLKTPFLATKHDMQRKKAFWGLDYVAVLSEAMKATVKAKHVEKIYNGIARQTPAPLELPGGFNLVAVGGLRPVKRFDRLIRALVSLPEDVHVTIVGEGEERDNLLGLARRLGISSRVHLVGFRRNVADYLAASDALIVTSASEGFSLAMIEGLFYAPVVLSTPVSGATEILPESLLFEPEKIARTLTDLYRRYDDYRAQTRTVAQRYGTRLSIEGCAEEYIRFYGKIIADFHTQGSR